MKKKRILNVISLMINLSIIYFTISGVSYSFRTDVIREVSWFGYTGFKSLRFFTNLSNIFVAIAAFIILIYNIRNIIRDEYKFPKWAVLTKYSATGAVTVTLMTVILFLAPLAVANGYSYFTLFTGNNIFMHFLTPILAIISFVICERNETLKVKDTIFGVLPVIIYSFVYLVMVVFIGEANGGWIDFYGLTFGGKNYIVPISMLVMYIFSYVFSIGLFLLQKRLIKKESLNNK